MERHIKRMLHYLRHKESYAEMKARKERAKTRKYERSMDERSKGRDDDSDLDSWDWDEVAEIEERGEHRPKHELRPNRRRKSAPPSEADASGPNRRRGVVVTIRKRRVRAAVGDDLVTCWLSAELAARQKSAIAVGDEIAIEPRGRDLVVAEVLPRRTTLSRPDPFSANERVVAANVDVVIQVSSVINPEFKPGLVDRYLVAIERGGAQPVLCVNKIDLVDEGVLAMLDELLEPFRAIDVPVVLVSATTGRGIETLREIVAGKTAVLVGHSGVGKSSILNALDESLELATRTLHKEGKVGRHTTTSSTLYDFPDGSRLIDTPGIREFGLFAMDRESLRFYFPEFAELALDCRYRNCTHLHEPDCAVQEAAEAGELPRYDRYRTMAEGL